MDVHTPPCEDDDPEEIDLVDLLEESVRRRQATNR